MLILTRKRDESIIIGDDIEIKILTVVGGQVFVGITAPRNIAIHREEIWQRIHRQKRAERDE